jgi:hypothetical protein
LHAKPKNKNQPYGNGTRMTRIERIIFLFVTAQLASQNFISVLNPGNPEGIPRREAFLFFASGLLILRTLKAQD